MGVYNFLTALTICASVSINDYCMLNISVYLNFRTIEALNFFYQLFIACFAECGGHCLYVS